MNLHSHFRGLRNVPLFIGLVVSLSALGGCGRNEIKVYSVPREKSPVEPTMPSGHPEVGAGTGSGMSMGMATDSSARPTLTYKKPDGWNEASPGQMRVASLSVQKDGKQADVSVVPLGGAAGGDIANINRWRDQVSLESLSADALKKTAQAVEIAGQPAELYELSGTNPSSGDPTRILGAIQHRDGTAWFFKMTGDDQLVAQQKSAFVEFLKSVSFGSTATSGLASAQPSAGNQSLPPGHPEVGATTAVGAAPSNEGKPNWQVPAGWQEVAGGQFLVAKFMITGEGNSQAAVNVSMSAGAGGGVGGNVNRWRAQLGLPPLAEAELDKLVKPVEIAGGKALFVELTGTDSRTGQPARVVGAIVPRSSQTWFYKLMGDAKLVEAQRDPFTRFVQSVKY